MEFIRKSLDDEPLNQPDQSVTIRVVLADSQGIYCAGIRKILALESDIRLVAQAGSLEQLRAALEQHPTDVVLAEGDLLLNAPGLVEELQHLAPGMKIIVQAASINESETVKLYRSGIRGIISRSISPDLLVRCIRCINSGETWIENQALNWVITAYRAQDAVIRKPGPLLHLSPKESAIIACITKGMRNKEIAFQLRTSEQVIKNYLRKIYDKLGVADRLELAIYNLQKKIVKTDVDELVTSQTTHYRA